MALIHPQMRSQSACSWLSTADGVVPKGAVIQGCWTVDPPTPSRMAVGGVRCHEVGVFMCAVREASWRRNPVFILGAVGYGN